MLRVITAFSLLLLLAHSLEALGGHSKFRYNTDPYGQGREISVVTGTSDQLGNGIFASPEEIWFEGDCPLSGETMHGTVKKEWITEYFSMCGDLKDLIGHKVMRLSSPPSNDVRGRTIRYSLIESQEDFRTFWTIEYYEKGNHEADGFWSSLRCIEIYLMD